MKKAEDLLADIDKDTIDYNNFDDSLREPSVLPSRFQIFIKWWYRYAVGMQQHTT